MAGKIDQSDQDDFSTQKLTAGSLKAGIWHSSKVSRASAKRGERHEPQ